MNFEKIIQNITTSTNVGIVLDSVEKLCENGLGYKRKGICTNVTDVAEYNPEKNELRIFDNNEFKLIDRTLLSAGLKEASKVKLYRSDTICVSYVKKRMLSNVEGFLSKIEFEGWVDKKTLGEYEYRQWISDLFVTKRKFYAWGQEWDGEDDNSNLCLKKVFKTSEKFVIKIPTDLNILQKIKLNSS